MTRRVNVRKKVPPFLSFALRLSAELSVCRAKTRCAEKERKRNIMQIIIAKIDVPETLFPIDCDDDERQTKRMRIRRISIFHAMEFLKVTLCFRIVFDVVSFLRSIYHSLNETCRVECRKNERQKAVSGLFVNGTRGPHRLWLLFEPIRPTSLTATT